MEALGLESNETSTGVPVQTNDGPFIPITVDMYNQLLLVAKVILIPALCILGLIGNTLGLLVLRRETRIQSHNFLVYMRVLMITHMGASFINLLYSIPHMINIYDFYLANRLHYHFRQTAVYSTKVFENFSVVILVMMTSERLISLLKPLTFREYWLLKFSRIILLVAFLLLAILMLPFPLCFKLTKFINSENRTEYGLVERNRWWGDFMNQYVFAASMFQYFILPITILVLNCSIPVAFYIYNRQFVVAVHTDDPRKQQQVKLTCLVISIAILYLLLSAPYTFILTLDFIDEDYSFKGPYKHIFFFFITIGTVLTHLNSALDSVIFIFSSRLFRKHLHGLCCKRCIKSYSPDRECSSLSRSTRHSQLSVTLSHKSSSLCRQSVKAAKT